MKSGKSKLNLPTLKIFISVLSNKAVFAIWLQKCVPRIGIRGTIKRQVQEECTYRNVNLGMKQRQMDSLVNKYAAEKRNEPMVRLSPHWNKIPIEISGQSKLTNWKAVNLLNTNICPHFWQSILFNLWLLTAIFSYSINYLGTILNYLWWIN